MSPQTWEAIPAVLLTQKDTGPLVHWLRSRGLQMSLLELDTERNLRGITPPLRPTSHTQTTSRRTPQRAEQRNT